MKNSKISEIKNMLLETDAKLKTWFKRKNMFCETIVHKWGIAIIDFCLLYTILHLLLFLSDFSWPQKASSALLYH